MYKLLKKTVKSKLRLLIIGLAASALVIISLLLLPFYLNHFKPTRQTHVNDTVRLLAENETIQDELAFGKSRSYGISLIANQYLRISLEQRTINLRTFLYTSDGSPLIELNCRCDGPIPISMIARNSGTYRLEIHSQDGDSTSGYYRVWIEELRQVNPQDNQRITADKAFAYGEQLRAEGKQESLRNAIRKMEEAVLAWKAVGDKHEAAKAQKSIGEIYHLLSEPETSLKHFEQAKLLNSELTDERQKGEILNSTGYVYLSLGDKQKALEYCLKALEISQATENLRGEAQALNNIGEIHYGYSKLQQSLEFYQKSLTIWRSLNDRRGQAQSLLNFGYTYSDMGEPQKTLDSYQQALSLWRAVSDLRGQALTLTAIGRLHSRLGESQEALSFFSQAMQFIQLLGDRVEEARVLNGIGYVHEHLGEQQKAIEYYNKALELFRSASYRTGAIATLHEIGRSYYSSGNYQEAYKYYDCFLSQSRMLDDQRFISYGLIGIGMVNESQGSWKRALEYYMEALPIYEAEADWRGEAFTCNLIGRIYHSRRQWQRAFYYYQHAQRLSQKSGNQVQESLTFYNIARAERDMGRPSKALTKIEEALRIVESLRTKVASNDLRASYFASIQQYYDLNIDLLMQQPRATANNFAEALEVSERARMRVLLDLLAEAQTAVWQDGDPALIQRAYVLNQEINARADRKMRLLNTNAPSDQVIAVVKEIANLTAERNQVEAQIRIKSPRYAALIQPQPVSLKEIQQLLDVNTLLLEFSLGSERSYLWVVSQTGLKHYELKSRAIIEKAAQPVYDLLSSTDSASAASVEEWEEKYWKHAKGLSELILKPVAKQLGNKQLLIVADGMLHYIPFGALPDLTRKRSGKSVKSASPIPLIANHDIINLPSASALSVLRREIAGRKLAPKAVAVLADPVYEADDLRVLQSTGKYREAGATQIVTGLPAPVLRSRHQKRGGGLARLQGTSKEAEEIEAISNASECFIAKGFEANRALAMNPELSQYRIIHLATHGVLDIENPELSAVVLSLIDRQGKPQNGYLRLLDIYNLNLPAELVVLSACDTGLGKEFKGEGLVGLTRGFMYAGAARVMASLWKVEDNATANLMKHFYKYMLVNKMSPSAALSQAQRTLWQDSQWNAPYYWAAFVMQGEWR